MAARSIKTGCNTCIEVVLAQSGTPSCTDVHGYTVCIPQTAVTPATGNRVCTIGGNFGAAQVDLPAGCAWTEMTPTAVHTPTHNEVEVNIMKGIVPVTGFRGYVGTCFPETLVTIGTKPNVANINRVKLIGFHPWNEDGHHKDHDGHQKNLAKTSLPATLHCFSLPS
jgi:hypothetical protein